MPADTDQIIIVCRRPGMIRGGSAHGPVATYARSAFTHAQLADIVGEPEMTVVVGEVVSLERLAEWAPKPDKPEKAKKA